MAKPDPSKFRVRDAVPRGARDKGKAADARNFVTGQNRQSTQSGWNTPFMQRFVEQYRQAEANGTAGSYFHEKRDGIAFEDDQSGKNAYKAGDVFSNGDKVGNIYDEYGKITADQMMSQVMLSGEEQRNGVTVDQKRAENVKNIQAAQSREAYEAKVKETKDAWGDTGDESILGGAAGGAALGAGIGSVVAPGVGTAIGGAIGGVVGAIAGGLNQDELTDAAARGDVQAKMAAEGGNDLQANSVRLQTWSGLAGKAMSPLSGLLHGGYDAATGKVGDKQSEFYSVDESGQQKRPGWLTGADVAAGFGDAALQFASPVGRAGFQLQMGGLIAGKTGTMVTSGGESFDDRSGTFDNVFTDDEGKFNALSAAAGVTDVGVDVIQLGAGAAMGKVARGLAGKGAAASTESVAGMKFTLNEAGQATKYRYAASVLAPSEAVQALGARASAMLGKARAEAGAISADDMFRAAKGLTQGKSTVKAALVNGFAEGGEEAVQAVAEPLSHQADVDPYEVMRSYFYGAAMGAGMTVGARARTKSVKDYEYAKATTLHALQNDGAELPRDQWDKMDRAAQEAVLTPPPAVNAMLTEQANQAAKQMQLEATSSVAAIGRVADAQRQRETMERNTLNRSLDGSYIITQAGYDIDDNQVVGSINTVVDLLERRGMGLQEQMQTEADPEAQAQLQLVLEKAEQLHRTTAGLREVFYAEGLDANQQRAVQQAVNAVLAAAYEGGATTKATSKIDAAVLELIQVTSPLEDGPVKQALNAAVQQVSSFRTTLQGDRTPLAKAASLMFERDPADSAGSFQMLMPQVGLEASIEKADTFLQTTHGPLKGLSGDYDGDKVNLKTRIVLDNDAWLSVRIGQNTLSADPANVVNIMRRDFEAQTIEVMGQAYRLGGLISTSNVEATIDAIENQVRNLVPFGSGPNGPIDGLVQGLRAGDPDAVGTFLNRMVAEFPKDMQEVGVTLMDNPYYALNSVIQRELQNFQFAQAATNAPADAENLNVEHVRPIDPESTVGRVQTRMAATWSQKLFLGVKGNDLFRKWQTLHYSKATATELGTQSEQHSTIREMTEMYELVSSGSTESALAALNAKDEISGRVLAQLSQMAASPEAAAQSTGRPALALLANLRVPNLQADNSLSREPITITQWLLRKSVDAAEAKNAAVLERKPELRAKYARLRGMDAGQAFVEVFSGFQMRELLGLFGDALGANLTVGQWYAAYVNQDEAGRQADARAIRSHAAYGKKRGDRHNLPILPTDLEGSNPVTVFQSVADSLLQAGNGVVSWNPTAKNGKTQMGRVEGSLGEASRRTSSHLRSAVEKIQQTMSQRERGFDIKSAAAWESLFDANPQLARSFMAMIPDTAVFGSFAVVDGQVYAAKWIYNLLTLPAEEAEMEYFRQTLLASWNALGAAREDDSRHGRSMSALKDRMHILMYQLADEARRDDSALAFGRFQQRLFESKNLDAFMAYVNNEIRQNEAPYTAWNRDIAEIDPTATSGGWQSSLEGAVQREAIADFSQMVDRFQQNMSAEARREKLDEVTFQRLRRAARDPKAGGQELVLTLQKSLDFAREFYAPLGPAARERMLAINLYGLLPNATDKGKTPPGFEALGAYQSKGNTLTFGTPEQVVLSSLTAYSAKEAGMDPTLLMKDGWSLMDEQGRPILLEQLTPQKFTELWEDPKNRPLLRAIIHPSVYEHTMDGRLDQRFLTDLTLSSLLSGNEMNDLVFGQSSRSRAIYLSYIEAIAGNEAVSRYLNDLTVSRTSSRTNMIGSIEEAENQVKHAEQDLAEILQILAFHAGTDMEVTMDDGSIVTMPTLDAMRLQMKEAQRQKVLKRRVGSLTNQKMVSVLIEEAKTNLFALLPDNASKEQLAEYEIRTKQLDALLETDYLQQVILKFSKTETPAQKYAVYEFVWEHPDLATMSEQATGIRTLLENMEHLSDETLLPDLSEKQWQEVSKAVISYVLEREATTPIPGVGLARIPGKGSEADLKYFDPSFGYLIDDLLSSESPLVKAAAHLKDTFARTSGRVSRKDVQDLIDFKIMGNLGTWSSELVAQLQQGHDRIDSSGAPFGISRGGSGPQFETTEGMATRRTFIKPPDSLRSTAELTLEQLVGDWDSEVLITRPGATSTESMKMALLDGRFTNEVMLTDVTTGETVNLMSDRLNPALPFLNSAADPNYGSITTDRLLMAAQRYAEAHGMELENVQLTLKFFHPMDQPIDDGYTNNLYFEGVAMDQGDTFGSLAAAWWFAAGGVDQTASRRALEAAKKRSKALKRTERISHDEKTLLETKALTDFSGMLLDKAYRMLEADLGDGEHIQPKFLNAVLKALKLRHFIRYVDDSNNVVVLAAEEVIALQNAGTALPENAELYILSDASLRTMLGERGTQGETRVLSSMPELDPLTIPAWQGTITETHKNNLPGMVETEVGLIDGLVPAKGNLFNTEAAKQGFQQSLSYKTGLDKKTASRFEALVMEQDQLAAEIGAERKLDPKTREMFRDHARIAVDHAGSAIQSQTSVSMARESMGMPALGIDEGLSKMMDETLVADIRTEMQRNDQNTGFVYYHVKPKAERRSIVDLVGNLSLQNKGKKPRATWIAPGDLITVELDSFESAADQAFPELRKALGKMMDMGANIVLVSSTNSNDDLRSEAGRYLRDSGYRKAPGSNAFYTRANPADTPITQQARYEKLMETEAVETFNQALMLQTNYGGLQENAAWHLGNLRNGQRIAAVMDPIPIQAYQGFGLTQPSQTDEVRQRILDGIEDLIELSNTIYAKSKEKLSDREKAEADEKLRKSLEKAANHLNSWGVYDPGQRFEVGDIIPLVHRDGRVLLYRHGHEAPDAETFAKMMKDRRMGLYGPVAIPQATTHSGEVVGFEPSNQYGLRVKLAVDLQTLGGKFVIERNGHKLTMSAPPKGFKLPEAVANRPVSVVMAIIDALSKENFDGLVNNFRNAFALLGIDFTHEIAQTIFNTDNPTKAQLDQVPAVLDAYHRRVTKQDLPTLDSMIKMENLPSVYRDAMREAGLMSEVSGIDPNWADQLVEQMTPATRITRAVLLYLMADNAQVEHVLKSGGMNSPMSLQQKVYTRQMPRMFTQVFDRDNGDLRAYVLEKLNAQFDNVKGEDGRLTSGMVLLPDFRVRIITDGAVQQSLDGYLQFGEIGVAGDNPALSLMSQQRQQKQIASPQLLSMGALVLDSRTSTSKKLGKTGDLITGQGIRPIASGTDLLNLVKDIPKEELSQIRHTRTLAEREYEKGVRELVIAYRQPLDTAEWTEDERTAYADLRNDVALLYGLRETDAELVDYWIRQYLGRYHEVDSNEEGYQKDRLVFADAKEAMSVMRRNKSLGLLPVQGGAVPVIHARDLAMLFNAAEASDSHWLKARTDGEMTVSSWDDWVHVALSFGARDNEDFDTAFLNSVDGHLHTYHSSGVLFAGLPMSFNPFRSEQLMDPETSKLVLSVSPHRREQLREEDRLAAQTTLEDIFGGTRVGLAWEGKSAPASAIERARRRRAIFRKKQGIPTPAGSTAKNLLANGQKFVTDGTVQNALFRTMLNMRASLALLNPMLYIGAPVEGFIQERLERAANVITGDATGRVTGMVNGLTHAETKELSQLYQALGSNQKMKGMVYGEITMHSELQNAGPIETFTHRLAKVSGKWQDPYWGMRADSVARRYVESAIRYMRSTGLMDMSVLQISQRLASNPEWLKQTHPAAHTAAMATLMNIRNVKPTVLSLAWRGFVDPLAESPHLVPQAASTLFLKLPFMFAGYTVNKAVQLLGLQGWDQVAALFLQGRKNPILGRIQALMAGRAYDPEATIDMTSVIETFDLTNAIVKSGLTHSGLFAFGLLAGGLGLSGEDEEDRRLRRASKYKGFSYMYDPRDIVNDFRNSDTIYLDWLPFEMDEFFRVTNDPNASKHSMAGMNWLLKSILNPIIGMERFFNTGNPWEITWAYKDAFYSMPLVNTMMWDDANNVYAELATSAMEAEQAMEERGVATPDTLPESFDFWTKAFMAYERMLLESSFINQLYIASDKYDRDAWVIPEHAADGSLHRNKLGQPEPTTALEEYVDPETGKVANAYKGRDWYDATLHGYTENRATLAVMSNLFTGFKGGYTRGEMTPKTRQIEKSVMSYEDAEAVVWGLYKGSVSFESQSLQGVFVPFELRKQLQENLMKRFVAEGKKMGLNDYKAKKRANELWYGSSTNPTAIAMKDIVWSDKLSYKQSDKYYQLNTTYVIGPDGFPWATGISRNALANFAGVAPLQRYYAGDIGGLGVDGRLNSTDDARGLNTGMRALEKVDSSWHNPTPQELADQIASKQGSSQPYTQYPWQNWGNGWKNWGRGWGGGGWGGFGGGGGGGGGFGTKINPPQDSQTPYANEIREPNVPNPLLRRATIRRERSSSKKGSLKQWQ